MRRFISLTITLLALTALPSTALAATGHPSKPSDLKTNNLLTSPDFGGSPCSQGWAIEVAEVTCNVGSEFVWLNHNNQAGDPAVKQTLSGLTPGAKYYIYIGWRGGDHGPIHGVTGARNIFAVDIDGKEIKRLTTSSSYTDWMTNDALATAPASANAIEFTATAASHTLRLRGEVGADGDVLVDWVQVSTTPKLFGTGNRYFYSSEATSAENAEKACQAIGSNWHLATINDAEENKLILERVWTTKKPFIWIGLNDRAVEGTFVWDGGQTSAYRNWGGKEPNNTNGVEDCVRLETKGFWNDAACNFSEPRHAYVCERSD